MPQMPQTANTHRTAPLGTLYLVPTALDFACDVSAAAPLAPLSQVLPQETLQRAAQLTHWICENAKSCRAYLKRVDALYPLAAPLQAQHLCELPRHVHKKGDHLPQGDGDRDRSWDARTLLAPLQQGHDMGLVSEAGMPAVADPGSSVVRAAHALGARVVPLVGPVSLLLALAASGLNGQNFAFVGYLPQEAAQRAQRLHQLEALALKTGQTQLFIETPYRNAALWQALLQHLQPSTYLSVAAGLTLAHSRVHSRSVAQWRSAGGDAAAPDKNTPAVFALGR